MMPSRRTIPCSRAGIRARRVARIAVSVSAALFVAFGILGTAGHGAAQERPDQPPPARGESVVERWQKASPEERREMREALRGRWHDASPRARRRMARRIRALEEKLPDFNAIERLILLRVAGAMPRDERRALRSRIDGIDEMAPAERQAFLAELKGLIAGFDGEVDRLERNRDRWKSLSESEREEYREQMRRLRSMTIEERRKLLEGMDAGERRGRGRRDERR